MPALHANWEIDVKEEGVKATLNGMQCAMSDPNNAALADVEPRPRDKGKEELIKKILRPSTKYDGAYLAAADARLARSRTLSREGWRVRRDSSSRPSDSKCDFVVFPSISRRHTPAVNWKKH
jgi:hypothetical protein